MRRVVEDTVRVIKTTGVTEYGLPETEEGREHVAIEVRWYGVYGVVVTSVNIVSDR